MGWWWSSNAKAPEPSEVSPSENDAHQTRNVLSKPALKPPSMTQEKRQLSREELANEEFAQFLAEFEAEAAREGTTTAGQRAASTRNQSSSSELNSRLSSRFAGLAPASSRLSSPTHSASKTDTSSPTLLSERHPADVSFEALAEETLSCRTAFDYAFYCQSMGGQWTNLYRYGELRKCSHIWNEFWMCMRAKSYPEEERRKMIKQHNVGKLNKYKTGPSSEDIWDVRDTLDLNASEPFKGDLVK